MQTIRTWFKVFMKKPYSDYIIIGGFIGVMMMANIIWIFAETRPPHWDMARHLWTSLQYLDLLDRGKLYGLLANYFYYPPLLYLTALPFLTIFGVSVQTAILSNAVFMSIAAFSMYGIGKQLWGRRTALLAPIFLLCSPMMITQFKEFQIDAPLTAIVSLTIYMLIRSKEFNSTRYSLLLGITLGLGMLTKWTYVLIMAAPLALSILIALIKSVQKKDWIRPRNLVMSLVATYAVASVWYITNLRQIMIDLTQNGVGAGAREGDPVVGTFASNIWYGWNLLSNQLYIIPFIFLVAGVVFLFVNKQNTWKNRYPLALAIGTLLLFTLLRNKDARYTLPALVGVSILATYWIAQLKYRKIKTVLSICLVAYLAVTFYLVSFGNASLPSQVTLVKGRFPITAYAQKGYIIGAPSGENWRLEEVFKQIAKEEPSARTVYYTGPDTIWFNSWDLMYYSSRYNVRVVGSKDAASFVLIRTAPGEVRSEGAISLPDGGTLVLRGNK